MAKIVRLSPTEVANNGPKPFEKKRQNLEGIEDLSVFWGYDPLRRSLANLLHATGDLLSLHGVMEDRDDKRMLSALGGACKNADQKNACLAAAKALVEWRQSSNVKAIRLDPKPVPYKTPVDELAFANENAIVLNDTPFLIYFDPRSSLTLDACGREFVKSLLWHTARIGNLRNAKIALLQTPGIGQGQRAVRFDTLDGDPLYSLDQIDEMVLETYRIWELILRERRAASTSEGAGDGTLI